MFSCNCFAFPYTSPWLSLFQSSICPVLPLPISLSLPFFICGSSILCHIFHSSFASEELWAKASSLPQQKAGTEAHTKQRLLWERGESRSPPNRCLVLLPFKSSPLRNYYFIPPHTHTSMGGKGSKRSLMELPDHEYSKKKKHSLLAKEEQMCMLSLEPFRNIIQPHPLEKITHQFSVYFQITPCTLILQIRSSPGTGSHQALTLPSQVPGFPMKNSGKLQYQS